ncbi:MAG: hypothetical protein HY812_10140 [Planctomycetes bacterium]|nr:hypothetical protein [Planctomycetota bacterium]
MARAFALAFAVVLVIAPFSWGGGGDNDSPYNLPNNPRDGGSPPPPTYGGSESCVVLAQVAVTAVPGAIVKFNTVNENKSRLQVSDAQLASSAQPGSLPVLVQVQVPGGATANVMEMDKSGKKWVDLQGRFRVAGGGQLLLTPPGMPVKAAAFLIIGVVAREGGALAHVIDVQPLDLGAGIDLVQLRDERLAAFHKVPGIVAHVVILGTSYSTNLQETITSIEAAAAFPVQRGAAILVKTAGV